MKTVTERFWSKVDKTGKNGCWIWTASLVGENGYGFFRISKGEGCMPAHRYSYTLSNGVIPKGMLVCHTCDNPQCVNPNHLFLGTHKDNALDREAKGRGQKTTSKLTEKEATIIKSSNLSQSELSKQYRVSRRTIASIQYGETWKHIPYNKKQTTKTYCCAICSTQTTRTIHIDMNFQYRKIQDDLCLKCDKVLKLFNNDAKLFQAAISYLKKK